MVGLLELQLVVLVNILKDFARNNHHAELGRLHANVLFTRDAYFELFGMGRQTHTARDKAFGRPGTEFIYQRVQNRPCLFFVLENKECTWAGKRCQDRMALPMLFT